MLQCQLCHIPSWKMNNTSNLGLMVETCGLVEQLSDKNLQVFKQDLLQMMNWTEQQLLCKLLILMTSSMRTQDVIKINKLIKTNVSIQQHTHNHFTDVSTDIFTYIGTFLSISDTITLAKVNRHLFVNTQKYHFLSMQQSPELIINKNGKIPFLYSRPTSLTLQTQRNCLNVNTLSQSLYYKSIFQNLTHFTCINSAWLTIVPIVLLLKSNSLWQKPLHLNIHIQNVSHLYKFISKMSTINDTIRDIENLKIYSNKNFTNKPDIGNLFKYLQSKYVNLDIRCNSMVILDDIHDIIQVFHDKLKSFTISNTFELYICVPSSKLIECRLHTVNLHLSWNINLFKFQSYFNTFWKFCQTSNIIQEVQNIYIFDEEQIEEADITVDLLEIKSEIFNNLLTIKQVPKIYLNINENKLIKTILYMKSIFNHSHKFKDVEIVINCRLNDLCYYISNNSILDWFIDNFTPIDITILLKKQKNCSQVQMQVNSSYLFYYRLTSWLNEQLEESQIKSISLQILIE